LFQIRRGLGSPSSGASIPPSCDRRSTTGIAVTIIVAGCDAPPILDAAEEVFDFVSPSIEAFGTIGFLDGAAAVRDDRQSAFVLDLLAYFFAVVGPYRP
jgi:hypothetical protein